MTSPLDPFDYRRIEIEGGHSLSAHCWKHLALVRFEHYFRDAGPSATTFLKKLNTTELWCGLQASSLGYTPIFNVPGWRNIDAGARGLQVIDQFFPRLFTMKREEWKEGKNLQRLVGILKHTDAIPIEAAIQVLYEETFGTTVDGKPLRHPYKGA